MARAKRRRGGIHINPANRGKLRKTAGKGKKGKNLTVAELNRLKRSRNPLTRKRATFALNARKWKRKKRSR